MEYEYKCPICGKIEKFKSQKTVEKKIEENAVCRNCRARIKQESERYVRNCPKCGKEIQYKYKSDYNKACRANSLCKSCAVSKSSIFQKGHHLNDTLAVRINSLDKLIEDESLQTFYWIGFLLADGSFYNESEFEFGLKDSDKNVLEEFGKYIELKGEIRYRESTNSNRIYFSNSISIPKFMKKYGFNFNKTYNPIDFSILSKYSKEQITALLIGIIDGDGSITVNGSEYSNAIVITAHKVWKTFYEKLLEFLGIPIHIKDYKEKTTISIGIYKRELCVTLKQFILNNNLFYLERKWNKILLHENEEELQKSLKKKQILKRCKPLLQYDMDGNLIKRWNSLKEAIENGYNESCIRCCINGEYKHYKKYIWKYE